MRLRLLVLISVIAIVGVGLASPQSHKPLTQEEILELTRNYVPSQELAGLIQQNGINFAPSEDFLKAVREAGGDETLITALRAAKPARALSSSGTPDASDAQLKQLLARGAELRKDKNYAEAEGVYRSALKLDPDRADIHFSLGYVLTEQKKYDEAIKENREAVRLRPGMAAAHNNLGADLNHVGKAQEAEPQFREAIRIRPKYALAHHNLGNVLEKQGKLQEAAEEYRIASQLEPDNAGFRASLEKVAGHLPPPSPGPGPSQKFQLKLDSVRFFESGSDLTPQDKRKYDVRFKRSSTRMVACELQMVHARPDSRVNFDIETLWFDPANNLAHQGTFHTFVPAGSAGSMHTIAWGCPEHPCAKWLKGGYHVDFVVGEKKLATGSFEIY